jgi:hypothetical protein
LAESAGGESSGTAAPGTETTAPVPGWERRLYAGWRAELSGETPGAFLAEWKELIGRLNPDEINLWQWQQVLNALQPRAEWGLSAHTMLACASIVRQASDFLHEYKIRIEVNRRLLLNGYTQTLISIGYSMTNSDSVAELADILAKELPKCRIPSCYVCLYEDSDPPYSAARLILSFSEDRGVTKDTGGAFPTRRLLPEKIPASRDARCQVMEPLYYQDHQLGYASFFRT